MTRIITTLVFLKKFIKFFDITNLNHPDLNHKESQLYMCIWYREESFLSPWFCKGVSSTTEFQISVLTSSPGILLLRTLFVHLQKWYTMDAEAIFQKLVNIIMLISTLTHRLQLGPNFWAFGPVLTGVR